MKHLYYIRHGESTANLVNMVGNDSAQLTEKGVQQAVAAGRYLQTKGIKPGVILCSPLDRAKDTAMYVSQEIGYEESAVEVHDMLRERWFGELEGKFMPDAGMTYAHYMANPLSVDGFKDVETLKDLHSRAERIVEMAKSRPENTVVLVAHGALLRSIHKVLNNIPYDQAIEAFDNAKVLKLI